MSSLVDETLGATGASRALRETTERLATEVPGESSCFRLGPRWRGRQLSFDMIIALPAPTSLAVNVRIPPGVLAPRRDALLRTGVGGHLLGSHLKLVRGGAVRPLVVPERRPLSVPVRLQLRVWRLAGPAWPRPRVLKVFSLSPQWIAELGVVRCVPPGRGQLRSLPSSRREAEAGC